MSMSTSTAPILFRRHTGRAVKRSRKTSLRREARVEGYLCERQLACRNFCHRLVQPHPADLAMGRNAHGQFELARKMEWTETGDLRQTCERDVVRDV